MDVLEEVTEDNLVRYMEGMDVGLEWFVEQLRGLGGAMGDEFKFLRKLEEGEEGYELLDVVEGIGKVVRGKVLADTAHKANGLPGWVQAFLDMLRRWVEEAGALMKLGAAVNEALKAADAAELRVTNYELRVGNSAPAAQEDGGGRVSRVDEGFRRMVEELVAQDVEWLRGLQAEAGREAQGRVLAAGRSGVARVREERPITRAAEAEQGEAVRRAQEAEEDYERAADEEASAAMDVSYAMAEGLQGDAESLGLAAADELEPMEAEYSYSDEELERMVEEGAEFVGFCGERFRLDETLKGHWMGKDAKDVAGRIKMLNAVLTVLRDPHEIWATPDRKQRTFFGVVSAGESRAFTVAFVVEGGRLKSFYTQKRLAKAKRVRKGILLYSRESSRSQGVSAGRRDVGKDSPKTSPHEGSLQEGGEDVKGEVSGNSEQLEGESSMSVAQARGADAPMYDVRWTMYDVRNSAASPRDGGDVSFSVTQAKERGLFKDGVMEVENGVLVDGMEGSFSVTGLHASPALFRLFSTKHVGEGTFLRYGWGLYFGTGWMTNRNYHGVYSGKDRVYEEVRRELVEGGHDAGLVDEVMGKGLQGNKAGYTRAIKAMRRMITPRITQEARRVIEEKIAIYERLRGRGVYRDGVENEYAVNYRAELDVDDGNVLHADEPIEKFLQEHPDVAEGVRELGIKLRDARGGVLYRFLVAKLGSPKAASEWLDERGIRGIKYDDGMGEGKFNYVIFNADYVTITHVNNRHAWSEYSEDNPDWQRPEDVVWEQDGGADAPKSTIIIKVGEFLFYAKKGQHSSAYGGGFQPPHSPLTRERAPRSLPWIPLCGGIP